MNGALILATLGLCEHCSILLDLYGLPGDSMNGKLHCPSCRQPLSGKSFGYEEGIETRQRWVGKDGNWTDQQPTEDFILPSGTEVLVRSPASIFGRMSRG